MVKFKPYFERHYPRLERMIAIVALINLALVVFDLTYLNLRPVYRQYLSGITHLYEPIKGIEAHPQTEQYQAQVDALRRQIAQAGLRSPLASIRSALTISCPRCGPTWKSWRGTASPAP